MQTPQTIDEYIANFPENISILLEKIRKLISDSTQNLTETINYWVPTFKLKNKNFIHFWAFKTHISLFPWPETIKYFEKKLENYVISKWTIQFDLKKEIPFVLIQEIVDYKNREEAK